MTSISSAKKSVSFPDQVVSAVHSVERNDESLNELLYYSADDYKRFKMERRQRKAQNQRSSCRRRGMMYESIIARKGFIAEQAAQINHRHMMMFRLQPSQPMQAF